MADTQLSIREVEELVGKKPVRVEVREREILIYFGGTGHIGGCYIGPHEGGAGADIVWKLRR